MVLFNYATRELTAKVVYYGAGLCGKTTNLEHIHKNLPEKSRGKMLSLATQTDRTLFFDFLPLDLGSIKGMKTRVQLYTVPGQVFYDATRKLVLKGADGVVFVVDSQKEMLDSNLDSWENLKTNLLENNLDINAIPLVIQYNKRDLPNVLPIKDLNKRINVLKAPFYEAVALTGTGVQETLKGIAKIVMKTLAKKYSRDEDEVAEAVQIPVPQIPSALKPLPADEALDLSVLDEEIKDLPAVEEEEPADEALHLEPVDSIESSSNLGQIEDVPELHDLQPVESHEELTEITELPPVPAAPAVVEPPPPPRPAVVTSSAKEKRSSLVAIPGLEELLSKEKKQARSALKTEKKPVLHTSEAKRLTEELHEATVTVGSQDVNVPVEISVGREGQDVKLHISITLKIRVHD